MPAAKDWQSKAQICRDIQRESITKQWMLPQEKLPPKNKHNVTRVPYDGDTMSAKELEMTEQNASGLLRRYENGEWAVEEVTTAFLKRATIGQQLLNFATEFLTDSALETARSLDRHFKSTGKLIGPLHGVPVSVKEHVPIGGKICHAGFVSKIHNIAKEDAFLVQLLKKAGAVITVRTNQPQSLMHLDTNNNINGRTLNPHHLLLSPGGSSGGEGASIGFKCAVLGVGTDIGGSVRCPAAFNNCYGLRTTALRNPTLGNFGVLGGQESIRGIVGPLGQSIDDLWLFEKSVLDQEPWEVDTSAVPIPWRGELNAPKDITVGIMFDDGVVRPHPPILRALRDAKSKLEAAGIKTVDWKPSDHSHGWDIVAALYFPDGGQRIRETLAESGEPMLPLTEWALRYSSSTPLSIAENWSLNVQREAYRREYHALMKKRGVDVILCPAYTGVGVLQVFPTGMSVDKDVDTFDSDYKPMNSQDEREWKAYSPDLFDGVPITLQLAGKHFQDENLLRAAKLVETVIKS